MSYAVTLKIIVETELNFEQRGTLRPTLTLPTLTLD